jgi:hypothetical protein
MGPESRNNFFVALKLINNSSHPIAVLSFQYLSLDLGWFFWGAVIEARFTDLISCPSQKLSALLILQGLGVSSTIRRSFL